MSTHRSFTSTPYNYLISQLAIYNNQLTYFLNIILLVPELKVTLSA